MKTGTAPSTKISTLLPSHEAWEGGPPTLRLNFFFVFFFFLSAWFYFRCFEKIYFFFVFVLLCSNDIWMDYWRPVLGSINRVFVFNRLF